MSFARGGVSGRALRAPLACVAHAQTGGRRHAGKVIVDWRLLAPGCCEVSTADTVRAWA
jgi:hypothetical protein